MTAKRKIDVNAFPEKIVVLKEVVMSRKALAALYEYFVDRINDYHFDEDDVVLDTSEMLEFVDENKFAAAVQKALRYEMKDVDSSAAIDALIGQDFFDYTIPDLFVDPIKKSKKYQNRIKSMFEREKEREIQKVIEAAKRLGLTVTR